MRRPAKFGNAHSCVLPISEMPNFQGFLRPSFFGLVVESDLDRIENVEIFPPGLAHSGFPGWSPTIEESSRAASRGRAGTLLRRQ